MACIAAAAALVNSCYAGVALHSKGSEFAVFTVADGWAFV
jgi:hypothetical protein